jgi:hypothetical protein
VSPQNEKRSTIDNLRNLENGVHISHIYFCFKVSLQRHPSKVTMTMYRSDRFALMALMLFSGIWAFAPPSIIGRKNSLVALQAKQMKSKQMELLKKLELAKQQKMEGDGEGDQVVKKEKTEAGGKASRLSDQETKAQNDRLRFEELLQTQAGKVNSDESEGYLYLNANQEEEEISAYRKYTLAAG